MARTKKKYLVKVERVVVETTCVTVDSLSASSAQDYTQELINLDKIDENSSSWDKHAHDPVVRDVFVEDKNSTSGWRKVSKVTMFVE